MDHPMDSTFGPVIHRYTRAEAIADGCLVDVTSAAHSVGFRLPVALTRAAWSDCVEWDDQNSNHQTHQDEAARLRDVLWLAVLSARKSNCAELQFQVLRVPNDGHTKFPKLASLRMTIGPGDEGEPVITIMLRNED
jgi:hypothetical protein